MALLEPLQLSSVIQSAQGGALFQGNLYVSLNPPSHAVIMIDLLSGFVTVAVESPIAPEAEGLAFADLRAQGRGQLHVMNGHNVDPGLFSSIFHWDVLCDQ